MWEYIPGIAKDIAFPNHRGFGTFVASYAAALDPRIPVSAGLGLINVVEFRTSVRTPMLTLLASKGVPPGARQAVNDRFCPVERSSGTFLRHNGQSIHPGTSYRRGLQGTEVWGSPWQWARASELASARESGPGSPWQWEGVGVGVGEGVGAGGTVLRRHGRRSWRRRGSRGRGRRGSGRESRGGGRYGHLRGVRGGGRRREFQRRLRGFGPARSLRRGGLKWVSEESTGVVSGQGLPSPKPGGPPDASSPGRGPPAASSPGRESPCAYRWPPWPPRCAPGGT